MNTRPKRQVKHVVASAIHDTGLLTTRVIAGEAYAVADITMVAYTGHAEEAVLDIPLYAAFSLDENSARSMA